MKYHSDLAPDLVVDCPNCGHEIRLTESLAAPLLAASRADFEAELAAKEEKFADQARALDEAVTAVAKERQQLASVVSQKIDEARPQIAMEEQARAREQVSRELRERDERLAELNDVIQQSDAKLEEAQRAQAGLLRQQRDLADAKRELELTIERRVHEQIADVRAKAKREVETENQLKVRERDETIGSLRRQIEDLKRSAEQGSQQLQGEVQELELEAILRTRFPRDLVEPVPKGDFGGDVLQRVYDSVGSMCGVILWETKRTRKWSDVWLAKLRGDQRQAQADVAVIISHALPESMQHAIDLVDGVWVADPRAAIPIAIALRESLIALAAARQASEGQQTKIELVYQYLAGARFRHRVEAIVERFTEMQGDLDRERRGMTRLWARREEQIRAVTASTAGMYGDLQGIVGRGLQEIDGLDHLKVLRGPTGDMAA